MLYSGEYVCVIPLFLFFWLKPKVKKLAKAQKTFKAQQKKCKETEEGWATCLLEDPFSEPVHNEMFVPTKGKNQVYKNISVYKVAFINVLNGLETDKNIKI